MESFISINTCLNVYACKFSGGAAEKAGVQTGDKIVKVGRCILNKERMN